MTHVGYLYFSRNGPPPPPPPQEVITALERELRWPGGPKGALTRGGRDTPGAEGRALSDSHAGCEAVMEQLVAAFAAQFDYDSVDCARE